MKSLLLMRHAKSSWDDPDMTDQVRPLNRRGRRDAPRLGQFLRQQFTPELILCSTAVRARQTRDLVAAAWERPVRTECLEELYHASSSQICAVLRQVTTPSDCILLIGHNPGLADFLSETVGYARKFPTAAVAWLEFAGDCWSEFQPGSRIRLKNAWSPRDLPESAA